MGGVFVKKFIKLIERVYKERFSLVMNKIVSEKIPVAIVSISPLDQAIEIVKNIRGTCQTARS